MSNIENKSTAIFATKFAAIATTVGSAVGLGNIWRFPYEAGKSGGGAFLMWYLIFVLLIGVPILIAEFSMGRGTRKNIYGAYHELNPKHPFRFAAWFGIIGSWLILGFYSVVAGWTVEYCIDSAIGQLSFSNAALEHDQFQQMTTGWRPVLWTIVFCLCNFFILIRGVTKGIEKVSNILMPLLFLLLVAFCINSLTLPGLGEGIKFLFKPDFEKINSSVLLSALGQAFFSLSLGIGCMLTYASYFSNETKIGRTAVITALLDSLVAILAGIVIFPAVFSFGISPSEGPTLVFETLPHVFAKLPAGAIWSTLFFLLLFLASVTSTVSLSEISISYFTQQKNYSRTKSTVLSCVISLILSLICALSLGPWENFTICGLTIFNLLDYVASNICMPLGGMICSIFIGWFVDKRFLTGQLTPESPEHRPTWWIRGIVLILKWICPLAIFIILLDSIGLF
ncbi:MAG: sodium-dependent transporter [Prevotella sp.]|nr:sodium-dependent transporter [Bacteroides sp.]MCM1367111.1 sodium-dependent transporter [Prevotella sp.]MCM1437427.1 sodium-dependent transporter [Prevotella sp.]